MSPLRVFRHIIPALTSFGVTVRKKDMMVIYKMGGLTIRERDRKGTAHK